MQASCGLAQSPISPPSLDCMNPCQFIPAAWVFSLETTSRAHPTSTFR